MWRVANSFDNAELNDKNNRCFLLSILASFLLKLFSEFGLQMLATLVRLNVK